MNKRLLSTVILVAVSMSLAASAERTVTLKKSKYLDKCKGAWAGQMFGVCFGDYSEFQSNAKPITGPVRPWRPEYIKGALQQDDCYVEMTFLKALEEHGIGISYEQAGKAFAASEYPLWHANRVGRDNVRAGIMPPMSGNPKCNIHADDIDFQIEADLFGILHPGMPQSCNHLCDIFGHIMNYGDGLYGGMFIAGMYSAAYFESRDVEKVVRAGLACIPEGSEYHKCISDVLAWHQENPNDWLATWNKIEQKWQDDVDCERSQAFNIDAKLNGAYVVVGLLYGDGDMVKTCEMAMRCGQDSDCNPSNAGGVLGCMKGYKKIPKELLAGMKEIQDKQFIFTNYSFDTLIPACQRITEQIIARDGGQVRKTKYRIALQAPKAPDTLERWDNQLDVLGKPIPQIELDRWSKGWTVVACGTDMGPGVQQDCHGRKDVLLIHPVSQTEPAIIESTIDVPKKADPKLLLEVGSHEQGNYLLKVIVNGKPLLQQDVDTKGQWTMLTADLAPYAGQKVTLRIENHATGWAYEAAYISTVQVQ